MLGDPGRWAAYDADRAARRPPEPPPADWREAAPHGASAGTWAGVGALALPAVLTPAHLGPGRFESGAWVCAGFVTAGVGQGVGYGVGAAAGRWSRTREAARSRTAATLVGLAAAAGLAGSVVRAAAWGDARRFLEDLRGVGPRAPRRPRRRPGGDRAGGGGGHMPGDRTGGEPYR